MKTTDNIITDKVKSPLNYTGGKYKLLNQIIPIFPNDLDLFIDLFSGGGNVGVNVDTKKIINKYNLSNSLLNGYEMYNCTSDLELKPCCKLR